MKKLVTLFFALSLLGCISAVFADEPEAPVVSVDDGSQLPEGVEPLPATVPAE